MDKSLSDGFCNTLFQGGDRSRTSEVSLLNEALKQILACPKCRGRLEVSTAGLACPNCGAEYRIKDGILCFFDVGEDDRQSGERAIRDNYMSRFEQEEARAIIKNVSLHHCLSVMGGRAQEFRKMFSEEDWILDLGSGSGWCWSRTNGGALVLVDFSLASLKAAQRLLRPEDRALLVWADARALPFRDRTIAGVWSVQVFQHFPVDVYDAVKTELDRVLSQPFVVEIYNLNASWVHEKIYGILGKTFHRRGKLGEMELNRLSLMEHTETWKEFRHSTRITGGYSELFFHPDFRFRPWFYPARLERLLAKWLPGIASLFARQLHIRIDGRNQE